MKLRYEVRDSHNPKWRGYRYADLTRAKKELARSEPKERFYIWDRELKREIRVDESSFPYDYI